ncbi:MAG TPA: molybdopterin-binding protein [Xanthobacteraceae bacterium]|nr:molybdopterin-binding protein [Xanthobacteraceae bacterium]
MVDLPPEIQRIARLTPLADALACIDRLVAPDAPWRLPLAKAVGFTLAEDVFNRDEHPGSAIALRDGLAVRADATLDASAYAPVRLDGAPAYVDAGAALAAGADAVAPFEAVALHDGTVHVLTPLAPGDGVLPQGADAAPGDLLARAGTRLGASTVEALRALGVTDVEVRNPVVCIARANRGNDAIIDAVAGLLARTVAAAGAHVREAERTGLAGALEQPGRTAIILIGGSGSGPRDRSVADLSRRGEIAFHGVGLAPGETAAFGMIDKRPVLVVPGRLDAALAVWLTLGRRMVARLAGHDDVEPTTPVTLTRKIASTLGLAEIVPVARADGGVAPLASGYLPLQALARADGYVLVPADSEGFPAGAAVAMRPLP